ncbi:MAG: glutamate--tRNA ligase, partial [Fervidobacterium sp.]
GWSVDEEVFDYTKKIESFSPDQISNKNVVFDYQKLEWVNGKHMRILSIDELLHYLEEWVHFTNSKFMIPKEVVEISREKVNTLKQLYEFSVPFVNDDYEYTEEYKEKFLKRSEAPKIIQLALDKFTNLNEYTIQNVEKELRSIVQELGLGTNKVFQTIRGALLGRLVTPGLFESITVLGKEKTTLRLRRTLEYIKTL